MSDVAAGDRYEQNPWARVVDAFVLWAIGHLDEASAERLEAMAPKLGATFGMEGSTWQQVVTAQMEFDDAALAWIRGAWAHQLEHDERCGQEPNPVAWAYAITDHFSGERQRDG